MEQLLHRYCHTVDHGTVDEVESEIDPRKGQPMGEQSGKVQTVLGLVEPSALGHTQPHEHLLVSLLPPGLRDAAADPIRLETLGNLRRNWTSNPDNLSLTSEAAATEEMHGYKAAGGGTIVDVTCDDMARTPEQLARISRTTGVHVVMGSGYYVAPNHPAEVENSSEEELAERIGRDVVEGVGDTGIKSGIVGEIGLSWPVEDNEAKALRAAAIAQRATGAALNVHPGRDSAAPLDAVRIVREAGGDPDRTIISHIDRTLFSIEAMLELAATGCYLEFDLFGQESSFYPLAPIDLPNDAARVNYLIQLIAAGYRDQLLISQDICTKTRLTRYGGEGYCHILENVLPLMERKGMSSEDIDALVVGNPARILTFP
jgi:phosphotriesterase-related protein